MIRRARRWTLGDDPRQAAASIALLVSWVLVGRAAWRSGAQRSSRAGGAVTVDRAAEASHAPRAAPALAVRPKRSVVGVAVLLLIGVSLLGLALSPRQATVLAVTGLGVLLALLAVARWAQRAADRAAAARIRNLLPRSYVQDFTAIIWLLRLLDEQRGFPLEMRGEIFADAERLRHADPQEQRRVRSDLERDVTRLLEREPIAVRTLRAVRGLGPALLALAFLVAWTLVFLLVWSVDANPHNGAYGGVGTKADLSDMFYLAINAAVGSAPPEPSAQSHVARTLLALEFASGALLLAAYATAVVRVQRPAR